MNYETFKEKVKAEITLHLPDPYKSGEPHLSIVSHVNEYDTDVLTLNMTNNSDLMAASPAVPLPPYYEMLVNGRGSISFDEILDSIASLLVNASESEKIKAQAITSNSIVNNINKWEAIKDYIFMEVVNKKRNENLLKEVPHRDFLDLSIIYRIAIDINPGENDAIMSAIIKNTLMETWGCNEEDLFNVGITNTSKLYPTKTRKLINILFDALPPEKRVELEKECDGDNAYVITNDKNLYGATTILYALPHFAEEYDEKVFYVLPSSIDEIIVIPVEDGNTPEELKKIVIDANRSFVPEEKILSDSVYLYNNVKKRLIKIL